MSTVDALLGELQRSFGVAAHALERPATILELQLDALEREPPPSELPERVQLAAVTRLGAREPVVPRERLPVDVGRVAELMGRLANALIGDASPLLQRDLDVVLNEAVEAALENDPAGVRRGLFHLPLEADTADSLLREALKPELLRTSRPLAALVGDAPWEGPRCPTCGSTPSAGTRERIVVCGGCGTTWRPHSRGCTSCGGSHLKELAPKGLVGAVFEQCRTCSEVLPLFDASPNPLGLSLHAVLAAPLRLAVRVALGGTPAEEYRIF